MLTNAQKISIQSQILDTEKIINARELGGYLMSDGRKILRRRLLRGGCLFTASDDDLKKLSEKYHVAHIFDFRTEKEVELAPDREVKGSRYTWLPTIDPETEKVGNCTLPSEAFRNLENYLLTGAFQPFVQEVARHIYVDMIENEFSQLQYAAFLQTVINTPNGAIYWHCSQGKDRTGLGAAFLLSALGADKDLIIADYDLSNEAYRNDVEKLSKKIINLGGGENELKVVKTYIGANTEYFIDALNFIDNKYGSLKNYLRNILCVSDDDCNILKNKFLEH